MIYGNKEGIRDSLLAVLESLYDCEVPAGVYVPQELMQMLAVCTQAINREISVYISRHGEILDVSIGDQHTVGLRDIHLRRNTQRLSMVRCIHTHPGGDARLSDIDISSLRSMRFDGMTAIGVLEGKISGIQTAFLVGGDALMPEVRITKVYNPDRVPQQSWMDQIEESDRQMSRQEISYATEEEKERAYLVGLEDETSLKELGRLAETAGAVVVGMMLQKKSRPDTATYIGSGKVDELSLACQARYADLVIFDDELSGVQLKNLEAALGQTKVLDRTALILDIFAQRAQSKEGRLQVELAQMSYQLPRLIGHGVSMSRLGGGIGTRGPGESRLEMDRRRIRKRIYDLRQEIEQVKNQRALRREKRRKSSIPVVALVGYTNAGKTTLLNSLSGAGAMAEDKLFATLDPLSRVVSAKDMADFILTDTVGFIRKLPHALVDAFQSTLEETLQADLLLIVSDASSPELLRQHDVVLSVLHELKADDKPRIDVLNKMDCASVEIFRSVPNAIPISARTGEGIQSLLEEIADKLGVGVRQVRVTVPYDKGAIGAMLYESGKVSDVQYEEAGTVYIVSADKELVRRLFELLGEDLVTVLEEQNELR